MTENIVIGDVRPRIQVIANGTQTSFIFPFPIFKEDDLEVFLDDVRQTSGFSVSGVGQSTGGNVVFTSPPVNNSQVTLRRYLRIERTSDFSEGGAFHASVINQELDYIVAVAQQNAQDIERSVTLDPTDGDVQLVLPSKTTRSNTVLAFDGNGEPVAGPGFSDISSAEANSLAAAQAAQDAESAKVAAEAARDAAQVFDPETFRRKIDPIMTADINDGAVTQAKIDPAVTLGGPSLGANSVVRTNAATINENITIPEGINGMSAGPITIADGFTLTVNGNYTVV